MKRLTDPPPRGTKVVCEGKAYDFGYVGQTGMWILYEPGCCNMQDATAIDPKILDVFEQEQT